MTSPQHKARPWWVIASVVVVSLVLLGALLVAQSNKDTAQNQQDDQRLHDQICRDFPTAYPDCP